MTPRRSIRAAQAVRGCRAARPAARAVLHPLHHGDRRMAQARAQALVALLIVAAAPMCGAMVAIILLTVRFQ